jgi:hypothetical protein
LRGFHAPGAVCLEQGGHTSLRHRPSWTPCADGLYRHRTHPASELIGRSQRVWAVSDRGEEPQERLCRRAPDLPRDETQPATSSRRGRGLRAGACGPNRGTKGAICRDLHLTSWVILGSV